MVASDTHIATKTIIATSNAVAPSLLSMRNPPDVCPAFQRKIRTPDLRKEGLETSIFFSECRRNPKCGNNSQSVPLSLPFLVFVAFAFFLTN